MNERDIIQTAIQRLKAIPGVDATQHKATNPEMDARLELTWDREPYQFHVEIKNELRNVHLPKLEERARKHHPFLLVAYRLFPRIKDYLREAGINYLEANGNMFIRQDGLHVDIDRYPTLNEEKNEANRAFTKTGLKVIFQLLMHHELLTATQRDIARECGVALGNIPQVMNGLLKQGYIVRKTQGYAWRDKEETLHKWVQAFNTTLKPTLTKGRYTIYHALQWQEMKIESEHTCWGGEPAADRYTNYLQPERLTLYTTETRQQLMTRYRLKPDEAGEVEVFEKFWIQPAVDHLAPQLLVYADLMGDPNKRNLETAQMIYDRYLTDI
ncbi:MAG: hypothetical protein KDC12_13735 [Flavobacteriales bacterium]|nr:hypothetical protein [Flavobacteriales bacterium]